MTKYFENPKTLEELRKQYKDLLKKYHPDCPTGSTEATQQINAEYEQLFKLLKDNHDKSSCNASDKASAYNSKYDWQEDEKLRDMLNKVIMFTGVTIEIIGEWIWITGNTYQYRKELKESGFKFAGQKKAWYWHSENYHKKSNKRLTMNDIRGYYGSTEIHSTGYMALEA